PSSLWLWAFPFSPESRYQNSILTRGLSSCEVSIGRRHRSICSGETENLGLEQAGRTHQIERFLKI
ncbi:MAG: hypothetical protein WA855_07540, partial [Candidatus Acidiferrales bacterium]